MSFSRPMSRFGNSTTLASPDLTNPTKCSYPHWGYSKSLPYTIVSRVIKSSQPKISSNHIRHHNMNKICSCFHILLRKLLVDTWQSYIRFFEVFRHLSITKKASELFRFRRRNMYSLLRVSEIELLSEVTVVKVS